MSTLRDDEQFEGTARRATPSERLVRLFVVRAHTNLLLELSLEEWRVEC